jgi:hypothetical protein
VQVDDVSAVEILSRDLLRAVGDTGRAGAEVISLSGEPPPCQRMALAESVLEPAELAAPN